MGQSLVGHSASRVSHAPRGNAEWTLCVLCVPRSTRSISAAFPRGAWERENLAN